MASFGWEKPKDGIQTFGALKKGELMSMMPPVAPTPILTHKIRRLEKSAEKIREKTLELSRQLENEGKKSAASRLFSASEFAMKCTQALVEVRNQRHYKF